MDHYRIYQTADIPTVKTESLYVTMHLDEDGVLRCVGTGRSPEEIVRNTYLGRLGVRQIDDLGREYQELISGQTR